MGYGVPGGRGVRCRVQGAGCAGCAEDCIALGLLLDFRQRSKTDSTDYATEIAEMAQIQNHDATATLRAELEALRADLAEQTARAEQAEQAARSTANSFRVKTYPLGSHSADGTAYKGGVAVVLGGTRNPTTLYVGQWLNLLQPEHILDVLNTIAEQHAVLSDKTWDKTGLSPATLRAVAALRTSFGAAGK